MVVVVLLLLALPLIGVVGMRVIVVMMAAGVVARLDGCSGRVRNAAVIHSMVDEAGAAGGHEDEGGSNQDGEW